MSSKTNTAFVISLLFGFKTPCYVPLQPRLHFLSHVLNLRMLVVMIELVSSDVLNLPAMADSQAASLCLVGAMDRLWFHSAVLFAEPISLSYPNSPQPISESSAPCALDSSKPEPEEVLPMSAPVISSQQGDVETIEEDENRPTRISQAPGNVRAKSHSPNTIRHSKNVINETSSGGKRLDKTWSSKTFEDLEQEEVRGFIDLGFRFQKEHISPRMMIVVPGLQRIIKTSKSPELVVAKPKIEYIESYEGGVTMRPYLSDAWLIKRPDSPLLNMRVRRGYAASDMKKQLKSWARTVASEVKPPKSPEMLSH